jgi:hypothetical protein
MSRTFVAFALFVCSALPAQTFTSPNGLDTIEGSGFYGHWAAPRRFQQIDETNRGAPRAVRSLAWRRDGMGGVTGARTLELTIKLGNGRLEVVSAEFDKNFTSPPTTVFPKATVNFPDWTQVPPAPPAPFDFVANFTTPWVYLGNTALVIDFAVENPSVVSVANTDRDGPIPFAVLTQVLGQGCVATGQNTPFTHVLSVGNNGPALGQFAMRIGVGVTAAPANANVLLGIATSDANLSIPGLCANVRALAAITLPLGAANASGAIPNLYYSFPHDPNVQGSPLVTQVYALDPGQPGIPVVVSDGRLVASFPSSSSMVGHKCCYLVGALPGTTSTGNGVSYANGLVMRLGL